MYDICIIGTGIVGLATAYEILRQRPDTKLCLLEKENAIAQHQSGNNSGVIHSGIYYKPNSLKAKNCTIGYKRLLDFCEEEGINYELCGKIIVATSKEELPTLQMLYQRGIQNGLEDIALVSKTQLKDIEPHVNGIKGITVPQAGIIDYKQVCRKLKEKIEEWGGTFHFNRRVTQIKAKATHSEVITEEVAYPAKLVINCGGLYSDKLATLSGATIQHKIIPFRGEYYELKAEKEYLVNGLIYPVPNPSFPFLGVHFTRMIQGGVEAGPNAVLAFKREGYRKTDFNLSEFWEAVSYKGFRKIAAKYWKEGMYEMYRSWSKQAFVQAMQQLIPELTAQDITSGGAGVRAQACGIDGNLLDDFCIISHKNTINVCNAPSPAATSSLSIGNTLTNLVFKEL